MILCYLTPEFDIKAYLKRKEIIDALPERFGRPIPNSIKRDIKDSFNTLITYGEIHGDEIIYGILSSEVKAFNIVIASLERKECSIYNLWHPGNKESLREIYDFIKGNFKSLKDFENQILIDKLQQ